MEGAWRVRGGFERGGQRRLDARALRLVQRRVVPALRQRLEAERCDGPHGAKHLAKVETVRVRTEDELVILKSGDRKI